MVSQAFSELEGDAADAIDGGGADVVAVGETTLTSLLWSRFHESVSAVIYGQNFQWARCKSSKEGFNLIYLMPLNPNILFIGSIKGCQGGAEE
jgi:hypothetical protein